MSIQFTTRNAIAGLDIESLTDAHIAGTGSLTASASSVTYTAPGDTAGTTLAIANGESILLKSNDTTLAALITRSTADDLTGTATLIITTGTTTTERLAQVDEAIRKTLLAQSSGTIDTRIALAELSQLRAYRNQLAKKLARENGTSGNVATVDLRSNF